MSHEIIEGMDSVVLHREQAWHGLGIVIPNEFTPREGLTYGNLEWGLIQRPLLTRLDDGSLVDVPTHVANYRADNNFLLGVVTAGYQPVSNLEMADFCSALCTTGDRVTCESVGSIRGGKRVWFLLKGEPFDVAVGDSIWPYLLVSNGHDGGASFRVTPTTIRTVCSNTLHAVIPMHDVGSLGSSAICLRHTTNIMDRLEEAQTALAQYNRAMKETRQLIGTLASKDVTSEEVQRFFLECYTHDFGPIPSIPQDAAEGRKRDKAMSAYNSFSRRFDDDRTIAGTSMWNAFNSYSGLVQHDLKARGRDDADRVQRRVDSNLFGLSAERTSAAFAHALSSVG